MRKNFFLEHPVFSIVISIVIFIIGSIGLAMLPVDQYPEIVPPGCQDNGFISGSRCHDCDTGCGNSDRAGT